MTYALNLIISFYFIIFTGLKGNLPYALLNHKLLTFNSRAMKKLSSIAIILFLCFVSASSQPCLPEGIEFNTQAQIDSFQINHPNCTEIEGHVRICGDDITNLNGLSVLTTIEGFFTIDSNASLINLTGLDNLTSLGSSLVIRNNYALTSLAGLGNLTIIDYSLHLRYNYALISLSGLDNLVSIGAWLTILFLPITNLNGLEGITSIGGGINIRWNDALISLTGLDNLTSIDGALVIHNNNALTSLTGLDNLTSIAGIFWVDSNAVMTSLTGLDNIDASSIDSLYIQGNDSLSSCEVQSICEYLAVPGGIIEIHDNASGCNTQEEVEEACENFSIEEQFTIDYMSLYPNPAHQEVNINLEGFLIDEVTIYTLTGQQILKNKPVGSTIDISRLPQGMYIVEVIVENTRLRQKLLVPR